MADYYSIADRVFSSGSSHNHPATAIRRGILLEMDSFVMKIRRRV